MHDPDGTPNRKLLSVEVERDGEALVVSPLGGLDISTTQTLDAELRRGINDGAAEAVLDLRELTFIDSTGLRLLVFAPARSRDNGDRLPMLHGSEAVERIIK